MPHLTLLDIQLISNLIVPPILLFSAAVLLRKSLIKSRFFFGIILSMISLIIVFIYQYFSGLIPGLSFLFDMGAPSNSEVVWTFIFRVGPILINLTLAILFAWLLPAHKTSKIIMKGDNKK